MPEKMRVQSEADVTELMKADPWRMEVLQVAENQNLPDWWIGAGFLRNIIWDALEGNPPREERDVDLVYFDSQQTAPEVDWKLDEELKHKFPIAEWEVRNQARMHYVNNFEPYRSTEDGIAHWVETATCVGVRTKRGKFEYLFCHGTDDLFNLVARPIEVFQVPELLPTFYDRIRKKGWQKRWPHLCIIDK